MGVVFERAWLPVYGWVSVLLCDGSLLFDFVCMLCCDVVGGILLYIPCCGGCCGWKNSVLVPSRCDAGERFGVGFLPLGPVQIKRVYGIPDNPSPAPVRPGCRGQGGPRNPNEEGAVFPVFGVLDAQGASGKVLLCVVAARRGLTDVLVITGGRGRVLQFLEVASRVGV